MLYQMKQTALTSGYNSTSYGKFKDTRWTQELQTRKPLSPIWASNSISRKRQTMGFGPLRHKCVDNRGKNRDGDRFRIALRCLRWK